MSIRVLFFGATAAIVQERELMLEGNAQTTSSKLIDQIVLDHPRLAPHKLLVSINQEYAAGDEIVRDGDEIAIFTAVSGG